MVFVTGTAADTDIDNANGNDNPVERPPPGCGEDSLGDIQPQGFGASLARIPFHQGHRVGFCRVAFGGREGRDILFKRPRVNIINKYI